MKFLSIDVETANPALSSICQIGWVMFEDGKEVQSDSILIDPGDWFAPINTRIHGITSSTVLGCAKFPDVFEFLRELTDGRTVATYTSFDRTSLYQACALYQLPTINCQWLDIARVVRRTWDELRISGYGLANVSDRLGIEFRHHDALEDARAAGLVLIHAVNESGVSLDELLAASQRKPSSRSLPVSRIGGPDGALTGECIVFTGALSMSRHEAADLAASAGANVAASVSKKVTLLVVGDQDIDRLAGKTKSSKHRRAEELVAAGQPITIIGESDFLQLCSLAG